MIEWYQSRKDELQCLKTAVKMGEDCEPAVLLADPKDAREERERERAVWARFAAGITAGRKKGYFEKSDWFCSSFCHTINLLKQGSTRAVLAQLAAGITVGTKI